MGARTVAARGLATRRVGIVGVLFHDFDSTGEAGEESALYVDQVIRGAERAATAAGDAVLIAATRGRTGRELAFSIAGKVDGLVVLSTSISKRDLSRCLAQPADRHHRQPRSAANPFDDISVDNRGAMRAIVDHLVTVHGYSDLAFMAGPARSPDSAERFAGFRDAMRAARPGRAPTPLTRDGGFTEAGGARGDRGLLAERRPPAGGRLRQRRDGDRRAAGPACGASCAVPADVAVTGFDDIASARHIRPALTTVHQPMRDVGEQAVEMLLARIADPHATPALRRPAHRAARPAQLRLRVRTASPRSAETPTIPSHGRGPPHADPARNTRLDRSSSGPSSSPSAGPRGLGAADLPAAHRHERRLRGVRASGADRRHGGRSGRPRAAVLGRRSRAPPAT